MNTPVSFELAKMLKEKGFNRACDNELGYNKEGNLEMSHYSLYARNEDFKETGLIEAPTIADVVMCLYEKHNIWICVDIDEDDGDIIYFIRAKKTTCFENEFKSPTEAYEAAIEYTLKNLFFI